MSNRISGSKPVAVPSSTKATPAAATTAPAAPAAAKPATSTPSAFDVGGPAPKEGNKGGWSPDVQAMLGVYGKPDKKYNRAEERILSTMATVHKLVTEAGQGTDLPGKVAKLVEHDARRQVFLMEGLLRMYKKPLGKEVEKLTEKVKALEDNLGDSVLYPGLLKAAQESKLDSKAITSLEGKQAKQLKATSELVAKDWTADSKGRLPILDQLIKEIGSHDLGSYDDERKNFLGKLAKEVRDVIEEHGGTELTEEGIHELRRDLRWLPIYVEASGGLIQLTEKRNPLPELKPLLDGETAKSKFVVLAPPTREANPAEISKSMYVQLMDAVLGLGKIKDRYEPLEKLAATYVESGAAKDLASAKKMVDAKHLPEQSEGNFLTEAGAMVEKLNKMKFFEALAKEFEQAAGSKSEWK